MSAVVMPLPAVCARQNTAEQLLKLGIIVTASADEADSVLKQLKAGFDFGVLAKEKSIDPSAKNGGYIGAIDPSQVRPELRPAVSGIKAGEFTGVIRTPDGFAIATTFSIAPNTQDLNAEHLISLAVSGAVRHTLEIGGLSEADSIFGEYEKPAGGKCETSCGNVWHEFLDWRRRADAYAADRDYRS